MCGYLHCDDALFDPVVRALFREVLRLYVAGAAPDLSGWLAALRDPLVGPALLAVHRDTACRWTVDDLAAKVACSRSTLHERFLRLLGVALMQYVHSWRMQLASGVLRATDLSLAAVALRVGYESEEAFNRAVKREMGKPLAQWRATARR